ncbi:Cof-type HAD-IIB family hydrolase [Floricoccus penangensis]|uniref:Cof-type HAD-IIB family hydrolase n=1 Tax=Floricoccus penangensis TaxID=1859475 RepID=UPI00203B32F5|nr:Cof-type HAD-IIB family hydrolase [Floricoccus penangensis]URZ86778.1 Cof-type HAD-IIB family hydrolase [Floricoccus penangensis]
MNKKLIAIDLDGTTLRSDNTISEYTKKTFKKLQDDGHSIVITTGRPYRMSIDIYKELGLASPMINFNGAMVSKPSDKNWNFKDEKQVDKDIVRDLLKNQNSFKLDFLAAEYRRKFFINNFNAVSPQLFGVNEFKLYNKLEENKLTANPNALLLQTTSSNKHTIAKNINEYYENQVSVAAWGGPNQILEIVPKNVSKASGLQHLLNVMNIDKNDLLAFGDEQNDVEMFKFAPESYAMKNANPILLEYAKNQTKWTNDEDGVAKTLENLLL